MKIKNNPYENLNRIQIKNKKLVDILNHKIFKGFRQIKNSKTFFIEKPNFVKSYIWDENKLEPFEDNYNLQYKKYHQQKNNIFNVITSDHFNDKNQNKFNKNINFRNKKKISNQNNFFHLTFTKNNNNNIFNNYIEKNKTERMNILFKEIFPNKNEFNIYNNFPLIFVEKKRKIRPTTAKKKIITFNENNCDEEFIGLTEKQFLYKISHHNQNLKNKQNNLVNLNNFNKNKGVCKGLTCSRPVSSQFSNYLEKKNKEKIIYKNAYTDQQEMEEYFKSLNEQEEQK